MPARSSVSSNSELPASVNSSHPMNEKTGYPLAPHVHLPSHGMLRHLALLLPKSEREPVDVARELP